MQQVVTLTGVEVKTGQGQSGPWVLKAYRDAGGNKYQTFKPELQQIADGLLNQPVSITWETQDRLDRNGQTRTNNVLTSIEAAQGAPAAQVAAPQVAAPQAAAAAPAGDSRGAVINRSAALARAIEAHAAGIAVVSSPVQLFAIADLFVGYIEGGSSAAGSAASSPAQAATAQF